MSEHSKVIRSRRGVSLPANHRQPWADDQLRLILTHAPTRANIERLAAAFQRREGAIAWIFRYAGQSTYTLEHLPESHLGRRLLRLRLEIGWIAYGDNIDRRTEDAERDRWFEEA